MLKEIKVVLNEQGFYDITVNGEEVCAMLDQRDILNGLEYIFEDPDGFVKEITGEDLEGQI